MFDRAAYKRAWAEANRQKMRDACKRWYDSHPEKAKAFRDAAHARRDPEQHRIEVREYNRLNYEVVQERRRKWRKENPEIQKAATVRANHRRRARLKDAPGGHYTQAELDAKWEAGLKQCAICEQPLTKKTRTIDHIVALANKGSNAISNIQFAHDRCNKSKGSK
jgi:5-methylcytosine-specific restriction endonuclease McrA